MKWYIGCFKKFAVFSGRARRTEYWMFYLGNIVIGCASAVIRMVILPLVVNVLGVGGFGISLTIVPVISFIIMGLGILYSLITFIPGLAVTVRRLHDSGKSGVWYLIIFIPLAGIIWMLVLMATDSQPGSNLYGDNPKGIQTGPIYVPNGGMSEGGTAYPPQREDDKTVYRKGDPYSVQIQPIEPQGSGSPYDMIGKGEPSVCKKCGTIVLYGIDVCPKCGTIVTIP